MHGYRESKLVALLLYHSLTTGQGRATLGEEYCNLMQVSGVANARPSLHGSVHSCFRCNEAAIHD